MLRRSPLQRRTRLSPRRKRPRTIKPGRVVDPQRLARVRALPCSVCGTRLEVEAHHIRDRQVGAGQRAGDDETIPLCASHHRTGPDAFHRLGRRRWEARFGTQREHLARTRALLETNP